MSDNSYPGDPNEELSSHWRTLKNRNFENSFPDIANWIRVNFKNNRSHSPIRRVLSIKWAAFGLLPVMLIVLCTYKIDRLEKFGDLITFSIDVQSRIAFEKLSILQNQLHFISFQVPRPTHKSSASFVSLIRKTDGSKTKIINRSLAGINGIQAIKITPIEYTVRESLMSTFIHTTLKLGDTPKPGKEELMTNVKKGLTINGFKHLDIEIVMDKEESLVIKSAEQGTAPVDSTSNIVISADTITVVKTPEKSSITKKENEIHLGEFEWFLGTWKLLYVDVETWHHWTRMNDSVLKCYILEKPAGKVNLTTGFYLKQTSENAIELHLKKDYWKLFSVREGELRFRNSSLEQRANVTWILKDSNKWQSIISGEGNKEFMNFSRQRNQEVEDLVQLMLKNNSDKGTKY